jgi:hypothetical protein
MIPGRALALWFLRHVAKPQHRLIFVDVKYCSTAEPNEFLEIAGEAQCLGFRRYYRVRLHASAFSNSIAFSRSHSFAERTIGAARIEHVGVLVELQATLLSL